MIRAKTHGIEWLRGHEACKAYLASICQVFPEMAESA